jgi:hypothetical protein
MASVLEKFVKAGSRSAPVTSQALVRQPDAIDHDSSEAEEELEDGEIPEDDWQRREAMQREEEYRRAAEDYARLVQNPTTQEVTLADCPRRSSDDERTAYGAESDCSFDMREEVRVLSREVMVCMGTSSRVAWLEEKLVERDNEIIALKGRLANVESTLQVVIREVEKISTHVVNLTIENEEARKLGQEARKLSEEARKLSEESRMSSERPSGSSYASVAAPKAVLPSASSKIPVPHVDEAWKTAGGKKRTVDDMAPNSHSMLSQLIKISKEQSAEVTPRPKILARPTPVTVPVPARSNPFEALANAPQQAPVPPVHARKTMTTEQALNIMRGVGADQKRAISTIIGVAKNETVVRPHQPSEYRMMLRNYCHVDLRRVFSIGWIGLSTVEFQLETGYVDDFKQLLARKNIEIDWIVDADPCSVSLFKRGDRAKGGSEAVKEAGRKYGARLRARLPNSIANCHKRFLMAEIARADAQALTGIYVPRPQPEPIVRSRDEPVATTVTHTMEQVSEPVSESGPVVEEGADPTPMEDIVRDVQLDPASVTEPGSCQ